MSNSFSFYSNYSSSNDDYSSTIFVPSGSPENFTHPNNNSLSLSTSCLITPLPPSPRTGPQVQVYHHHEKSPVNVNKCNDYYYNCCPQSPNSHSQSHPPASSEVQFPCSINTNTIQLRFLNPRDYETVKGLCEEWFPVNYPSSWYDAITSDSNFFSLAAILDHQIIGLIVAELKDGTGDLGAEDRDLLCSSHSKFSIGYILSLGVVDAYRRQGIASLLLTSLLDHLSSVQCKAVYLHVLSTNKTALRFYEKHRFRVHKFLPYYYYIGGQCRDGFTYVLYLNGGHGPWGIYEYVQHFCSILSQEASQVPTWCMKQFRRVAHSLVTLAR